MPQTDRLQAAPAEPRRRGGHVREKVEGVPADVGDLQQARHARAGVALGDRPEAQFLQPALQGVEVGARVQLQAYGRKAGALPFAQG